MSAVDPEPHIEILRADGSPVTDPDTIAFVNAFNALTPPVRRAAEDAMKAIYHAYKADPDALTLSADQDNEPAFTAGIFAATFRAAGLPDYAARIEATLSRLSCQAKGDSAK